MAAVLLTVAAVISGLLFLWAAAVGTPGQRYLLKPLTTIIILGVALAVTAPVSDVYRWLVVAGLLLSLAGDVFLMLPQDRFVFGLGSFLAAHLLYILAYRSRGGFGFTWWLFLIYLAYTAALLYYLWPAIGDVRLPVVIYATVLMVMGWQAAELWLHVGGLSALLAGGGAVLFLLSDSALAIDKFRRPFARNTLVVMTTYWAAQLLIAWSVHAFVVA